MPVILSLSWIQVLGLVVMRELLRDSCAGLI